MRIRIFGFSSIGMLIICIIYYCFLKTFSGWRIMLDIIVTFIHTFWWTSIGGPLTTGKINLLFTNSAISGDTYHQVISLVDFVRESRMNRIRNNERKTGWISVVIFNTISSISIVLWEKNGVLYTHYKWKRAVY